MNPLSISVRIALACALADMVKSIDAILANNVNAKVDSAMAMAGLLQDTEMALLVDQSVRASPMSQRRVRDIGEIASDLDGAREECVACLVRNGVSRKQVHEDVVAAFARENIPVPSNFRL
jgi:hypothetical protein